VAATNSALEQAKKRASEEMAKMSGGLEGLAEKMLG
jgi:DNA-binding protein YbaB